MSGINFSNYISFTPPVAPGGDNCASFSRGEALDRAICDNLARDAQHQAHTYVFSRTLPR